MKISPKLGSTIVAVVVGGFFAFVSYEGENRLQRSLYAGFVGLALGLTTGYKLLKTIDDKHAQQQIPKEHKEFNYDLWTRISNFIVVIVGFLLGWFIGSKMYPRDSAKEMGVALILSCIFLVVNFIVWKIIEKRAQEHYQCLIFRIYCIQTAKNRRIDTCTKTNTRSSNNDFSDEINFTDKKRNYLGT